MSRYGLPESICEGLYRKDGTRIAPKHQRRKELALTPAERYWKTLDHEQRERYRRAFDFNGPFDTVTLYAYSEKEKVTP